MKVGQTQLRHTFIVFLNIGLMILAISTPGVGQISVALSKKDANALMKTATTAEDHQKLAAYYEEQAHYLVAKSQQFAKRADFMDRQSKRGDSCVCAVPYRHLSNEYAREAKQAEQKVTQQERLAQRAGIDKPN